MDESPILQGRACDGCTMCCRVLGISEIDKPQGSWCTHCDVGAGCTIYDTRPGECRDFYCGYLTLPMVDAKWYPSRSKMVVFPEPDGKRISVHVDPGRPDAWKAEPFYSEIKAWARHGLTRGIQLAVFVRNRAIAILPDEDVDLGLVGPDERIVIFQEIDAGRPVLRAAKEKA
jgi:hypothetical protein